MTAGSAHVADDPHSAAVNDNTTVNDRFAGIDTRLYLVTDSAQCEAAGRRVAETVQAAVAGGVGIVQVRDKDIDDGDFYSLTRQVIAAVDAATRGTDRTVPVVLNDRVEVARRLLDEGENVHIHVGQSDTTVAEVRAALGAPPGSVLADQVGIPSVTPEEDAERIQRAIALALVGQPTADVHRDERGALVVSATSAYAAGRVCARLEVALAGEGLPDLPVEWDQIAQD